MKQLILIIAITSLLSCKKDPLPPATQSGANTLACKVNGKPFVGKRSSSLFGSEGVYGRYYINYGYLDAFVSGSQTDNKPYKYVELYIGRINGAGTYLLNGNYSYGLYEERYPNVRYTTNLTYNGSVTITKVDTVKGIISGTFAFTAVNSKDSTQTIRITDGRFDVGPNK